MKVAVLGAGIMGSGIGQLAAMAGHDVAVLDVDQTALDRGRANIDLSLARFVKAGRISEDDAKATVSRLNLATSIERVCEGSDIVVEAVPEIVDLKREVLLKASRVANPDALLGTNTSQISITSIGSALGGAAARLIGVHFFNPPVMMRLVELICGLSTSSETLERARAFAKSLDREVIVCRKDSPGFLTSRAYAAMRLECVRMVEEGLADPEDIDLAFRLGFNFPMGPLELGDFNGLDTFVHVLDALSEAFGERFKPTPMLRNMIAAGRLGRKAGRGFYTYGSDGTKVPQE